MDDAGLAMGENWKVLVSLFPKDWVERAWEAGAVERLRGFGDESALMRTLLLHVGRGYSLRETVVRAKATGVAEISDVALMKRLRKSGEMVALVVRFVVAGKWSGFGGIDNHSCDFRKANDYILADLRTPLVPGL